MPEITGCPNWPWLFWFAGARAARLRPRPRLLLRPGNASASPRLFLLKTGFGRVLFWVSSSWHPGQRLNHCVSQHHELICFVSLRYSSSTTRPHATPCQLASCAAVEPSPVSAHAATMGRSKQSGMSRQLDYRRMAQTEKQRQAALHTPTWVKVVGHCVRRRVEAKSRWRPGVRRRHAPPTRRCRGVCTTAWRFHTIGATVARTQTPRRRASRSSSSASCGS